MPNLSKFYYIKSNILHSKLASLGIIPNKTPRHSHFVTEARNMHIGAPFIRPCATSMQKD